MKSYNKLSSAFFVAALLSLGMLTFAGCTKVDDTLGGEYVPDNQGMRIGTQRLEDAKKFFETRLYQTDSIISSNISYGYFGTSQNDTTGLRTAGFMSQYTSGSNVDSAFFGFRPIFDSAVLLISIKDFQRDTLTKQKFNVYEITSNDYLTNKKPAVGTDDPKNNDSTFYMNFDPTPYVSTTPIFSFTFPNDISNGPAATYVKMEPTQAGYDFVKRLMISNGAEKDPVYTTPGVYYTIYKDFSQWVKVFKGFYIVPENPQANLGGASGSIYATELANSGFAIYGRNRNPIDPTLIKDTVAAAYAFYNGEMDQYEKKGGNQSINVVKHDYSGAKVPITDAVETNKERPLSDIIYVAGMGGVISEITFTEEFFKSIQAIIDRESETPDETGAVIKFSTLAINQARMNIYFADGDYDWTKINPIDITKWMNNAMARFGLYTDYKKLTAVVDYNYYYEKNYEQKLNYDGYINRSQGCYALDISGYLQELWNSYSEEKAKLKGSKESVDMSKIKNRTVYLGPDAYGLFGLSHSTVQGMSDATNGRQNRMKIDLIYTMIK